MKISDKGLALIKSFEGFSALAYLCPAGVWTVGYGHTKGVTQSSHCTLPAAEALIREDVAFAEGAVTNSVVVKLTQGQFDALVSFVFNLGVGTFRKSTLLRLLNKKDYAGAADEFDRWIFAGGKKQKGLVARRSAERALFLKG